MLKKRLQPTLTLQELFKKKGATSRKDALEFYFLHTFILRNGSRSGELKFNETPVHLSRMLFNSLQGTLLVKRSTDDLSQLEDVKSHYTPAEIANL